MKLSGNRNELNVDSDHFWILTCSIGAILSLVVAVLGIKLRWFKHRLNFEGVTPENRPSGSQNRDHVPLQGVFRQRPDADVFVETERPKSLPPVRIRKSARGVKLPVPGQRNDRHTIAAPGETKSLISSEIPPPLPTISPPKYEEPNIEDGFVIIPPIRNAKANPEANSSVGVVDKPKTPKIKEIENGPKVHSRKGSKSPKSGEKSARPAEKCPKSMEKPQTSKQKSPKSMEKQPRPVEMRAGSSHQAQDAKPPQPEERKKEAESSSGVKGLFGFRGKKDKTKTEKTQKVKSKPSSPNEATNSSSPKHFEKLKSSDDTNDDYRVAKRRPTGYVRPNPEDIEKIRPTSADDTSSDKSNGKVYLQLEGFDGDHENGEDPPRPSFEKINIRRYSQPQETPTPVEQPKEERSHFENDTWSAVANHRNLTQELAKHHKDRAMEMEEGQQQSRNPLSDKPRTMRDMKKQNESSGKSKNLALVGSSEDTEA